MPKVAAVSSRSALTSAALKALEPLMAVSQNSPSSLDHSSVTLERTLAQVLGIVGDMPKILSPPAGWGAMAPMVAQSC
eukprot:8880472-Pyramimonas_sp.AAC.1